MANPADLVDQLTRRKGMLSARGVLFPELGAEPAGRLAEGILRAPRRGWRSPPILSACAPERSTSSAPPAGHATSGRGSSARRDGNRRSCWRVRPRRGRQWSRRGSAARGGRPAPNRRCPRAVLPWSRSPNPPWPIPPPTGGQIPRRRLRCSVRRYRPTAPSRSSYLPPRGPPARLYPSLAAARARGAIVIERACDPWSLLDRADRVYSVGGEIGFLGAAGRSAGDRLRRRGLYGLGGH